MSGGLFGSSIWDYMEEERKTFQYVIKWVTPTEPGSGKIWSVTSPDDLDFHEDVKEVHMETPSYTKSGKIYTKGSCLILNDEAYIV